MSYIVSDSEKEYLKKYNIESFARPSVAADIVVLSMFGEGERENIRKLQTKALKVLMVKRNSYPYKGWWALPGGFCVPGEDVYETAKRELQEETGVKDTYLEAVNVYGECGRDPRGWIISNAFVALLNGAEYRLHAGSDAWEAKWFNIDISLLCKKQNKSKTIDEYLLTLSADEYTITAKVEEAKTVTSGREIKTLKIVNSEGIAFDHAKIIMDAIWKIRRKSEHDVSLIFDLLPEYFTISQAQNAYECLLDKPLIGPNFRRKINDLVEMSDVVIEGEGFRPARLYRHIV